MVRRTIMLLALAASPVCAAPPPPLAPGAVERDALIINVPAPDGFDEYLKHFAGDVRVIENQKEVGTGKSAWRAYLETQRNFGHKVRLVSYGNPIIVAESTWLIGNECCLAARVVAYHLRDDGLVDEVVVTSNGIYWGKPSDPD